MPPWAYLLTSVKRLFAIGDQDKGLNDPLHLPQQVQAEEQ
jgi:hypothetical protein